MIEIQVIKCSNCHAALPDFKFEGNEAHVKCVACRQMNVISRAQQQATPPISPLAIPKADVNNFIKTYTEQLNQGDGKDTNSLYTMGLLYLNLSNYERAETNLDKAINISPFDADMYYYYSLSLLGGRTLKTLDLQVVKRINTYLRTAIQMEEKPKYYMMLVTIFREYLEPNSINIPGFELEDIKMMYAKSQDTPIEDCNEIRNHCRLRNKVFIDQLAVLYGLATEEESTEEFVIPDAEYDANDGKCKNCGHELKVRGMKICSNCGYLRAKDDANVRYIAPFQRTYFAQYFFEPEVPERLSKPFYQIIPRIWGFGKSFLLMIVIAVAVSLGGWMESVGYFDVDAQGKIISAEDQAEYEQIKKGWFFEEELRDGQNGQQKLRAYSMDRSPIAMLCVLAIFFPIIFWLFRTIYIENQIRKERKAIDQENKNRMEAYNYDKKEHDFVIETDYRRHLPIFFGDMAGGMCPGHEGIVDYVFRREKIDEEDLVGKTLFCSWLGNGNNLVDRFSTVYFTIAALADDHIKAFRGEWNTYTDRYQITGKFTASYRDITNIDSSSINVLRLTVGNQLIGLDLPGASGYLCRYNDPMRPYSYNDLRTTDTEEFIHGLEKLVRSYKNR